MNIKKIKTEITRDHVQHEESHINITLINQYICTLFAENYEEIGYFGPKMTYHLDSRRLFYSILKCVVFQKYVSAVRRFERKSYFEASHVLLLSLLL